MKKVLFIIVIIIMVVLSCGNNNDHKEYTLKGGTVITTEGDTITIYGGLLYKPCTQNYWCIREITVSK